MNRIFLFLAVVANLGLLFTFGLGWRIGDPASLAPEVRQQVAWHFLSALGTITFALLVHAIVLTYFMGTGRWIEETCLAYRFTDVARRDNIRAKYRVIPGMMACMLLLIITGAFGAMADPATNTQMESAATIHFVLALLTITANIGVSFIEYFQIRRNSRLVEHVYDAVQAARRDHGLEAALAEADTSQ